MITSLSSDQKLFYTLDCTRLPQDRLPIQKIAELLIVDQTVEMGKGKKFQDDSYLIVPEFLQALLILKNTGLSQRIPNSLTKDQKLVWQQTIDLFCGVNGLPETNFLTMIKIKILYDLEITDIELEEDEMLEILREQTLYPFDPKHAVDQELILVIHKIITSGFLKINLYLREGRNQSLTDALIYFKEALAIYSSIVAKLKIYEITAEESLDIQILSDSIKLLSLLIDSLGKDQRTTVFPYLLLPSKDDHLNKTINPKTINVVFCIFIRNIVYFKNITKERIAVAKTALSKLEKSEDHKNFLSIIRTIEGLEKRSINMLAIMQDLDNALEKLGYFILFTPLYDEFKLVYPITKSTTFEPSIRKMITAINAFIQEYQLSVEVLSEAVSIIEKTPLNNLTRWTNENILSSPQFLTESTIELYREMIQQYNSTFQFIEYELKTEIDGPSQSRLKQAGELRYLLSNQPFLDPSQPLINVLSLYICSLLHQMGTILTEDNTKIQKPMLLLSGSLFSALYDIRDLFLSKESQESSAKRESLRRRILERVTECDQHLHMTLEISKEDNVEISKEIKTNFEELKKIVTLIEDSLAQPIHFLPNNSLAVLMTHVNKAPPKKNLSALSYWAAQTHKHLLYNEGITLKNALNSLEQCLKSATTKKEIHSVCHLKTRLDTLLNALFKVRKPIIELFHRSAVCLADLNFSKILTSLDSIQKKMIDPQEILDWLEHTSHQNIINSSPSLEQHLREAHQFLQVQSFLLFSDLDILKRMKQTYDLLASFNSVKKKKISTSPPKNSIKQDLVCLDHQESITEIPIKKVNPLEEIKISLDSLLASKSLKNEMTKESLTHLSYYIVLIKQFKLLAKHPYIASLGELLYGGLAVEQALKALGYLIPNISEQLIGKSDSTEKVLTSSHDLLKLFELFKGIESLENEIPSLKNKQTIEVLKSLKELIPHISRHIPAPSGISYDPLNKLSTLSKSAKSSPKKIKDIAKQISKQRQLVLKDENNLMPLVQEMVEFIRTMHKAKTIEMVEDEASYQVELIPFRGFKLLYPLTPLESFAMLKLQLEKVRDLLAETERKEVIHKSKDYFSPKQFLQTIFDVIFVLDEIATVPSEETYKAPLALSILYSAKVGELLEGVFLLFLTIHKRSVLSKEYESLTQKRLFGHSHMITEFAGQVSEFSKGAFVLDEKKHFLDDLQFFLIKLNHYPFHKGKNPGRLSQVFQVLYEFSNSKGKQKDIEMIMREHIFAMGPFAMDIALQVLELIVSKKK